MLSGQEILITGAAGGVGLPLPEYLASVDDAQVDQWSVFGRLAGRCQKDLARSSWRETRRGDEVTCN